MSFIKVVIGIPTYKRPLGLRRLLESIAKQQASFKPVVIVADNEGDSGQGLQTVQRFIDEGYPFELIAFPVNDRGISQVRNSLMDVAFNNLQATHLAMIDDDEWVEEQWISELVKIQKETHADVVGGSVSPEFENGRPDWAKDLDIFYDNNPEISGVVDLVQGTTNVLIKNPYGKIFAEEKFDPFYSLVGGGDKEFFTRLKNMGAIFAFAHKANAHEIFTSSRVTKKWVLERAYRIGAGDMRIIRLHNDVSILPKEFAKIIIALIYFSFKFLIFITDENKAIKAKMKIIRQLGKLSAFYGKQKEVYSTTHGK